MIAPPPEADMAEVQSALGLDIPKAVLLIVRGSTEFEGDVESRLMQLLSRGIARAAADIEGVIIDGGRHTGVMAMMGQGVADRGHKSLLIGVAPASKVTYPDRPVKDGKSLDHNHSHFVLTDGEEWGDEIETMCELAATLAQDNPVATILVNGDDLAKKQILQSVRQDWPIIVIRGSGNLADEITDLRQQRPTFIPDPDLAEIMSDGNLHFFPLDVSIGDFERQLRQLSSPHPEADDTTLELAWRLFAMYDANANRQQKQFSGLQRLILGLGVAGTLLVIIQNQYGINLLPIAAEGLHWVIVAITITVSLLVAASNRFNAGTKWILSRASAESIKKEIYRYRTRAEIYSHQETKSISRDIKLTRKTDTISSKLMQTEVNTSAMLPYDGPIPPKYGAADGDDGLSYLTPEQFLKLRLKDQLTYYRNKTGKLEKELKRYQWLIYLAGAVGTFLAAIGFELWIALTTALVTAFTTFLEYQKTEEKLMRYNQTATDLANIERWWVALSPEEQADPGNINKLVGQTETSIHQEHAAWVQDMQDAMAELRAEQTGEERGGESEGQDQSQTKKIIGSSNI